LYAAGEGGGRRLEVPAALGALAQPGFQGGGATQAVGDAGEDDGEVGGAEGYGEQGEARGGGALLGGGGELAAEVDQAADDAKDAADAGGHGWGGPRRIGVFGGGRGVGGGGHERKQNIGKEAASRKIFRNGERNNRTHGLNRKSMHNGNAVIWITVNGPDSFRPWLGPRHSNAVDSSEACHRSGSSTPCALSNAETDRRPPSLTMGVDPTDCLNTV
jgi:hypothetical protein